MCTAYLVDEATKQRIAAYGAKFRQVSASPFGKDDQIGMLNLIDASTRQAILSRADAGKVFDLAVDHFIGMPGWIAANDPAFQIWMTHTPRGEELADVMKVGFDHNKLVSYSGDAISMYTHCGTHVDSLNHFGYNGKVFNNFTSEDHLGSRHWTVNGADKHPPVIARGILLDVAGLHGLDMMPPSHGIGPEDLEGCLRHQKTELRCGDVVMVRTGRMRAWPDPAAYMTNPPGLTRAGAEFLAKGGAIIIGADNHCVEQSPSADPQNWQVVHTYLLAEAGIPMMEIVNLEELAEEKVYEYAFLGACIKLRGATGSPMRPIAMPLRD
ncbi:MAG: cyclase family protein [Methylobacteriaceae bacterium]|nr:cyclase family protein [Methylobacteriaceae bacterium]MBV9246849.1 cyclase family protein [Methylobacteriaceae bacterium]